LLPKKHSVALSILFGFINCLGDAGCRYAQVTGDHFVRLRRAIAARSQLARPILLHAGQFVNHFACQVGSLFTPPVHRIQEGSCTERFNRNSSLLIDADPHDEHLLLFTLLKQNNYQVPVETS
jgi:hypothetical protein